MPKAVKDIQTAAQLRRALEALEYENKTDQFFDITSATKTNQKRAALLSQLTKSQLEKIIQRPKHLNMILSYAPGNMHANLINLLGKKISSMQYTTRQLKITTKVTTKRQQAALLSHISGIILTKKHNRHIVYFLKKLPEGKRLDFLRANDLLDGSHGTRPLPNPVKDTSLALSDFVPFGFAIRNAVKAKKRDDLLWKNCRYYFDVLALLPKNQRLDYLKSLSTQFKKMIADYADEYAHFHTDVKSHYGYFDEKDRLKVVNILQETDKTYISRKAGTILKHLPDKQIPGFIKAHAKELDDYVSKRPGGYTYLFKCVAEKHHDLLRTTITTSIQNSFDKKTNKHLYKKFLLTQSTKAIAANFDRVHKDFKKIHLIVYIRAKLGEIESHPATARLHKPVRASKQAYETLLDAVQKDDPEIIRKYLMNDNKGSYPDDKLFQLLCAHVISPAPSQRVIKQRSPSS